MPEVHENKIIIKVFSRLIRKRYISIKKKNIKTAKWIHLFLPYLETFNSYLPITIVTSDRANIKERKKNYLLTHESTKYTYL